MYDINNTFNQQKPKVMKILFKTTDRNEANAQLRAFAKGANPNLDLRKETSEINFLTRVITAPLFALEYKGKNSGKFNIAMLVVTNLYSVPVFMTRNMSYWFDHRERRKAEYSFCVVMFNEKSEYVLIDCSDMTAEKATAFFNEIEKERIR